MIDLVLPYKKNKSEELKWAVRSLKNLRGIGTIYIIGDRPDYEIDAVFIPETVRSWSHYSPYHNQISKYLTACSIFGLSDEVILTNDDIFCLEPSDPKNYNRGYLLDHINERRNDAYRQALINTRHLTMKSGHKEVDFDLHVPMIVNKKLLRQAITELIPIIQNGKTILLRSYLGNRFNLESEYMEDVKNSQPVNGFVSSNERTFAGELGEMIRDRLCE